MAKNENKSNKHFFKDFKAELKKVIWPTPKQLVNNTTAVVTIVLITAAIVFVLDLGFDMMNKYGISKAQNAINEKFNTTSENTTSDESSSNETTDENTEENTGSNQEENVEGSDTENTEAVNEDNSNTVESEENSSSENVESNNVEQ